MIRTRVMFTAVALALVASAAGAQQTTAPTTPKAGAETRARAGQRADGRKGRRDREQMQRASLRGVDLTDAQKAQLKTLREKYKGETKPIMERMRPAMQDARAARQKGDTAAARAALARTEADRTALKGILERQHAEMLTILTPEQRAKYDANAKARRDKQESRKGKHDGRKGKRQSRA